MRKYWPLITACTLFALVMFAMILSIVADIHYLKHHDKSFYNAMEVLGK